MCSGTPCKLMAIASASITPRLLRRRATFSARQARLCSSISVRTRSERPSWVRAWTKSKLNVWRRRCQAVLSQALESIVAMYPLLGKSLWPSWISADQRPIRRADHEVLGASRAEPTTVRPLCQERQQPEQSITVCTSVHINGLARRARRASLPPRQSGPSCWPAPQPRRWRVVGRATAPPVDEVASGRSSARRSPPPCRRGPSPCLGLSAPRSGTA